MGPILGTLLIGLVTKFGGDFIVSAAKKMFSGSTEASASATGASSFQSALDSARADRSASAESAPSIATPAESTNFAALPAGTANAVASIQAVPPAVAPQPQDVVAAYMKLDSIQTA